MRYVIGEPVARLAIVLPLALIVTDGLPTVSSSFFAVPVGIVWPPRTSR